MDCPLDIENTKQIQTVTVDDMDAEITALDTAGYVINVRVGQENVSGEEFRNTYNLASSCFTLQRYNGKMRITTRGIGHGLGMSQNTANKMSKKGKTYEENTAIFLCGDGNQRSSRNIAGHRISPSLSGKNIVRGGDKMNKRQRPSRKKRGATVAAVLCFVAAIAIVGTYTFNDYKETQRKRRTCTGGRNQ